MVLANLVAAVVIGICSVIAARIKQKPMILFNDNFKAKMKQELKEMLQNYTS